MLNVQYIMGSQSLCTFYPNMDTSWYMGVILGSKNLHMFYSATVQERIYSGPLLKGTL